MTKIRFWLRAPKDNRPLSLLLQDVPCELEDWEEVPQGAVYPIYGLHDTSVAGVLVQRDMSNPVWVLNEIMRILLSAPLLLNQVKDKAIAHVEILTDTGSEVLLTEAGNGQVRVSRAEQSLAEQLPRPEPFDSFRFIHKESRWSRVMSVLAFIGVLVLLVEKLRG